MTSEINKYDKMDKYVESIFNVFRSLNKKMAIQQGNNDKIKMISLIIYNYVRYMAKQYNIILNELNYEESINLSYFFEYIEKNEIVLYDFSKIELKDVDLSKKEDLERYVLTHIYYLTQK
jgi:hypothetical protein